MGEKLIVGPINKGLKNDRTAFIIDNDSFPTLVNAYQWRGRIKRKRGTQLLGRLTRYFDSTSSAFTGTTLNPSYTISFNGSGVANLLGPYTNVTPVNFSLQSNGTIVPGSVTINGSVGPVVYTDPTEDGYLTPTGTGGPNTINYASGVITIPAQAGGTATVQMQYFPDLPNLGDEDLILPTEPFPATLAFDTTYSYSINATFPYTIFSVSFYKNPVTGFYTGYTQKTTWTPTTWNGQTYQQFGSTNYQGAFWVTNGMEVPFDTTNIGMQFKAIVTTTIVAAGPPARVTLQITGHGLVVGDFVFVNEVLTTTGINFETGYVDTVTDPNNVIVTFPNATVANNGTAGIAQYLTNRSDVTKDCLRFYDGNPVTSATPPVFQTNAGWVNFMPPLSLADYSIADLPADQYYLVGAKIILQYKDRLLFFGPIVQTSTATPRYLQDTVIYSQNGVPYYTASFPYATVNPTPAVLAQVAFSPILVPTNQTADPRAFWEDLTGFGGFIQAGYDQAINTVNTNEDVLIVGFSQRQARFVYTSNDIIPFNFFTISSELGSTSTFSAITLDRGAVAIGLNGIIITSQFSSQRIDLEIPDQVFQFNLEDNGTERVCSQRDFINEWIYFTYSSSDALDVFPSQTLLYNYRDNSWAIFDESYTTYGQFRRETGQVWDDLTTFTWDEWNDPWDSGEQTLLQPEVIAGNQQGFIMIRSEGTGEDPSGYIQAIDANSVVTSPNHNLDEGDYIQISGALGTIGSEVNGEIFSIDNLTTDTFRLNPRVGSGTYLGGGVFTRLYVPFIQTKQFPMAWQFMRKTRIGPQMYLLTTTGSGQITLQIYLSQNANNPYNSDLETNSSLIYTDILFTSAESGNLMTPLGQDQAQIWHRMNTSLIGDTVQIGFTLSDDQMRDGNINTQEIELHAFTMDVSPSQMLV